MRRVNEESIEYPDLTYAILDGEPFSGQAVEHEDGFPSELTTYIDGKNDGPQLSWAENGQLIALGNSTPNHGSVGPWHYWDEEGNLVGEVIKDRLGNTRIIRNWDKEGNLIREDKRTPAIVSRKSREEGKNPPWR